MALEKCKECGAEVAADADACGSCGKPSRGVRIETAVTGAAGLLIGLYVVYQLLAWLASR